MALIINDELSSKSPVGQYMGIVRRTVLGITCSRTWPRSFATRRGLSANTKKNAEGPHTALAEMRPGRGYGRYSVIGYRLDYEMVTRGAC